MLFRERLLSTPFRMVVRPFPVFIFLLLDFFELDYILTLFPYPFPLFLFSSSYIRMSLTSNVLLQCLFTLFLFSSSNELDFSCMVERLRTFGDHAAREEKRERKRGRKGCRKEAVLSFKLIIIRKIRITYFFSNCFSSFTCLSRSF